MRWIKVILLCAWLGLGPGMVWAEEAGELVRAAQAQYEQNHFEQALKLYKQVRDEGKGDDAVDYNIALCHLRLGDTEQAITRFEAVSTRIEAADSLRADAFYNIGVTRARAAKSRWEAILAPSTQPSPDGEPQAKEVAVEELEKIADDFLRAISAFKRARELQPNEEIEHNITAARILRRNVLGRIQQAREEAEKEDMLDDPRGYLEKLIDQQALQVGLGRFVVMATPEDATELRQIRRSAVRMQRQIMEETDRFAGALAQFKESADANPAAPPASTQPSEPTPREQVYQKVAQTLDKAVTAQRDACAYLLDGELAEGQEQEYQAMEAMVEAAYYLPQQPDQALAAAYTMQTPLQEQAKAIEEPNGWLGDPAVGEVEFEGQFDWPADKTAYHFNQQRVWRTLNVLQQRCAYLATTSQPAESQQPSPQGQQQNPLLDPELNKKLAQVLAKADEPGNQALQAIVERDKEAWLGAQQKIMKVIEEAADLLPKSLTQRLAELIRQQAMLNEQTQSEAGDKQEDAQTQDLLGKVQDLATRLKNKLFKRKPADVAAGLSKNQQKIYDSTLEVHEELKKMIPSGQAPAVGGGQDAKVQSYIQAGRHLEEAELEMLTATEGLDKAAVQNSLQPIKAEGPVQVAQQKALEALLKALQTLQDPQQEQEQEQQQKQDQQQQQEQQQQQDRRRQVEQMDRQREEARRQLHQKKPRTVIKDW